MTREKEDSDLETYLKASAVGAVAGLRCLTAPALLGYAAQKSEGALKESVFAAPKVAAALGVFAAGELVGDKLPWTPNRTELPGLISRIISGAAVGGTICAAHKKSALTGALLGALAAVGAAYAGQNIRREIADQTGVPSAALGAVEDLIAVGIGLKAIENER